MGIAGLKSLRVSNADEVSMSAVKAHEIDHAVTRGIDRSADRSREIGTLMHPCIAQHWMDSRSEVGSDASALHRCPHQRADRATAVAVEPSPLGLAFRAEAVEGPRFLRRLQRGVEQPTHADSLARAV